MDPLAVVESYVGDVEVAIALVDGYVCGRAQGTCDKESGSVYVWELCDCE
jgi:hypothetical protein